VKKDTKKTRLKIKCGSKGNTKIKPKQMARKEKNEQQNLQDKNRSN
jgi:hypothetical protein